LDLLYLIRFALSISDYWHPHSEIQTDFLSDKIGRYPVSMEAKADYPGPLGDEEVRIVVGSSGKTPASSTVDIILYGLGTRGAFIRMRDERCYQKLVSDLRWLASHGS